MSTRANIVIVNEKEEPVILYHHHDGYPSGVGQGLTDYAEELLNSPDKDKIIATPKSLGDWLVSPERDDEYEYIDSLHGDIEYLYVINLANDTVNCYDAWCWDVAGSENDAINGQLTNVYSAGLWDAWSEVKNKINKG